MKREFPLLCNLADRLYWIFDRLLARLKKCGEQIACDPEGLADRFGHPAGEFVLRKMNMRVAETFFMRDDKIIRAGLPEYKGLH